MSEYYSQRGEDKWIVENLKLPEAGTFVEVGAYDGVSSSNTLHFERFKGWTGLCVEPIPDPFIKCRANRREAVCCAIGAYDGTQTISYNPSDPGASGFDRPGFPLLVPVLRLQNVIPPEPLTLLSIDTEGTELDVWEGIGEYRPEIVIMEYQTFSEPPNDKAIVERMARDGYREVHRTQYNLIFTR